MVITLTVIILTLVIFLRWTSTTYFISPNRYSALFNFLTSSIKSLIPTSNIYTYIFSTFLISLLLINLFGNIPGVSIPSIFYFYTSSLSITIWVSLILVVSITQLKSFISHMLPFGSPVGLILFLPLIEIFSHIIRPLTLIIRLRTNLSSGHIIMYMFSFFSLSSLSLTFLIRLVLILLFSLELIISALQAYIFSSLSYLYISETE